MDEAARLADEAVAYCHSHRSMWDVQPWIIRARCLIACGEDQDARRTLIECEGIIDELGAVAFQLLSHERRGRFADAFESEWNADDERRKAY